MKVQDDWTTEIYIQPLPVDGGSRAFFRAEIKNIFDNITSRSDPNYAALNTAHRTSVFFNGCGHQLAVSWKEFKCSGHNHRDWILYVTASHMYRHAVIYATADIPPYNGKHGYAIQLTGNSTGNAFADTLTKDNILSYLTVNTDGNTGANVYVEVTDANGFRDGKSYARHAKSVNIHC